MRFLKKCIGKFLWYSLGTYLPVAHFRIRFIGKFSKLFRALCGKLILEYCGDNVNIYPKAEFSSSVRIGDNSDIGLSCRLNGSVIIGNNVIMGPDVWIYTVNHSISNPDIPINYQGNTMSETVIIGDDCWIGARVTILPGVSIGKGAVIGAAAVVSKNIPDYAVAVGNPAKIVKFRR